MLEHRQAIVKPSAALANTITLFRFPLYKGSDNFDYWSITATAIDTFGAPKVFSDSDIRIYLSSYYDDMLIAIDAQCVKMRRTGDFAHMALLIRARK